ncbi:hypothetical protein AAE478_000564 [Parahypoxylon ruwenzoriense]
MKFSTGPLFATLALTAYLPNILAAEGLAASKGSVAVFTREVANNGTAAANGTEAVEAGKNEENNNEDDENVDENADEEENANEEENVDEEQNADEEDANQDENVDENVDENADENVDENVDENNNENNNENNDENLDDVDNIDIDENNIEESLRQNIGDLMLSLGICNFDINSLLGLGLGNQIQLLLQLQQLAQLQQLGIVNSFSIEQLIQQEILLNNFNLNIIKRTVDTSVKHAARGKKRTIMTKRACQNKAN